MIGSPGDNTAQIGPHSPPAQLSPGGTTGRGATSSFSDGSGGSVGAGANPVGGGGKKPFPVDSVSGNPADFETPGAPFASAGGNQLGNVGVVLVALAGITPPTGAAPMAGAAGLGFTDATPGRGIWSGYGSRP